MVDYISSIDHINYISDDRIKDFDRFFFQSVFLGNEGTRDDDGIADFDKFCGVEDLPQTHSTCQDFPTITSRQQHEQERIDLTEDRRRPSKLSPTTFQPLLSSAHDSASRTLEELLDELISPQTATSETNDICSAILRHPDLSKKPSGLNVFSKMNGGLKNYVPGTAQAWLYVPRKRAYMTNATEQPSTLSRLALIFVYPDECGPSGQYEDPKTKLHFGGRAHEINNGTVFLQHGSYKFLGCVYEECNACIQRITISKELVGDSFLTSTLLCYFRSQIKSTQISVDRE